MMTKKILIQIPTGLEARPVALLVQVASQYESSIYIECEDKKVNAKSIMGMMSCWPVPCPSSRRLSKAASILIP